MRSKKQAWIASASRVIFRTLSTRRGGPSATWAARLDLDEAEALRLRVDEPIAIRMLGQRFAEMRGQAEEARKTIARHHDQIKRHEIEWAELEQPPDVEPLRRAVNQARKGR